MYIKDLNIVEELKKYKYSTSGRAKFHEVDSFEVVHNIQYLYWMESARLDYFEEIGVPMNMNTITLEFPVMVVQTEINYFSPIQFSEQYKVLSRVTELKNSSLIFNNIVLNHNYQLAAAAQSVLVHLDRSTMKSKRIPENIRQMLINYEGSNLTINEEYAKI